MPNGLPESIEAEIAGKRTPSSEDQPNNGGEPKKDDPKKEETPKDEPKKDEAKKAEKPEPKKGEAAKPKNGQSIAQVAAAADEEDEDDEDDEDDHDGDDKKSKKRGSLFREYLDLKKSNKNLSKQYTEMGKAMTELVEVVKSLKGNKDSQIDEIEEFAEEWGLNKDGAKALVGLLEKKLSTKFKPTKKDDAEDDDDEDEEDEPKKKAPKADPKKAELKARQIELAIEGEYEDFIDSFPDVKNKINLKAIKRYIIGDAENLEKSFADIVTEMYPGVLDRKAALDGGSDAGNRDDDGENLDWNDPKVQQKVQKDPKVRDQYHSDLMGRVKGLYQ